MRWKKYFSDNQKSQKYTSYTFKKSNFVKDDLQPHKPVSKERGRNGLQKTGATTQEGLKGSFQIGQEGKLEGYKCAVGVKSTRPD